MAWSPSARQRRSWLVEQAGDYATFQFHHLRDGTQQELRSLDLQGRELPSLRGPVFLVHGKDDTVIPAGESMKLAGALGLRAELYLIERFAHVDAGTAGLGDNLRLWRVVIRVLEERDRSL